MNVQRLRVQCANSTLGSHDVAPHRPILLLLLLLQEHLVDEVDDCGGRLLRVVLGEQVALVGVVAVGAPGHEAEDAARLRRGRVAPAALLGVAAAVRDARRGEVLAEEATAATVRESDALCGNLKKYLQMFVTTQL